MMTTQKLDAVLWWGAAIAILVAIGLFFVGCAKASSMADSCQLLPCVYDSTGKLVGVPVAGEVYRQIDGQWYTIQNVSADLGITPFSTYFYTQEDCGGMPFLQGSDWLPKLAAVDATRIYAPGPDAVIQWHSQSFPTKPGAGGKCINAPAGCVENCLIVVGPRVKVETISFTPPFSVR